MVPKYQLSNTAKKAINAAIDNLFDKLKVRALGPSAVDKRIYVSYEHWKSIPGIFESAAKEEGVAPDQEALDSILQISSNYIDSARNRAKARIINEIESELRDIYTGQLPSINYKDILKDKLNKVWNDISNNVSQIINSQFQQAKNMSLLDGIVLSNAAIGVSDPTVCFIVVKDADTCENCIKLHLMPDLITPRVWKLSEVGHGYYKKGQNFPCIGGLHPNCRCTLVSIMSGYGFNSEGKITYIGPNYDVYADQRGLQHSAKTKKKRK